MLACYLLPDRSCEAGWTAWRCWCCSGWSPRCKRCSPELRTGLKGKQTLCYQRKNQKFFVEGKMWTKSLQSWMETNQDRRTCSTPSFHPEHVWKSLESVQSGHYVNLILCISILDTRSKGSLFENYNKPIRYVFLQNIEGQKYSFIGRG